MTKTKNNAAEQQDDIRMNLASHDAVADRMEQLKMLMPEIFVEGKLDPERLRQYLGDFSKVGAERYGLNWAGKADAIRSLQIPSHGTLVPLRKQSINFDESENMIIEGDNLEVLKLLQKSYHGKIKMIYIDPPYNTGGDFIYPDNFKEGLDTYLRYSGQVNEEGFKVSTNSENGGRYHSNWLNMMYPRLFMAKNLLRDDGVIFVSIGHQELHNLRHIMDEIFGETCFIGLITWKARVKPINIGDAKFKPQQETEYVVVYERIKDRAKFSPLITGQERSYPHTLNGRKYRLATILKSGRGTNRRDTMRFKLGDYEPPEGQRWQGGEDLIKQLHRDGYIEFKDGTPFRRYFEDEEGAAHDPFYCFMEVEWAGTSESGKFELNELIGQFHGFDTVKPSRLIRTLLQSIIDPTGDDICIDFFGGSGTTADAVLQYNRDNNAACKFIIVQLPEKITSDVVTAKTGAAVISDLTFRRVKTVIEQLESIPDSQSQTLGYKAFRLTSSNFKLWDASSAAKDMEELAKQLELYADNVLPDRKQEDILYEIILKQGQPLTAKIEKIEVAGQQVFSIDGGAMLICLDDPINEETLVGMLEYRPAIMVALDKAFHGNDQLKSNIRLQAEATGESEQSRVLFKTV